MLNDIYVRNVILLEPVWFSVSDLLFASQSIPVTNLNYLSFFSSHYISNLFSKRLVFPRAPITVRSRLTYHRFVRTLRRAREDAIPPIPDSLEEYASICLQTERFAGIDGQQFCRGKVGEGDTTSVLFLAREMEEILSMTSELSIDGTFKTRPRRPRSSQLLTIMAERCGYVSTIFSLFHVVCRIFFLKKRKIDLMFYDFVWVEVDYEERT